MISKTEVDRFLNLGKSRFISKTGANKIMFGKFAEVTKEIEGILKQVLEEHKYDKNPMKVDTHLEVHS